MTEGSLQPPDIRLYYTSEDLSAYISSMTPEQKFFSVIFHTSADIIYPVMYTLLLSMLVNLTKVKKQMVYLPLVVFVFDLLENADLITLITVNNHNSSLYSFFLIITPYITTLKWISAGSIILVIVINTIRLRLSKK